MDCIYKLTDEELKTRRKIRREIIKDLENKDLYKEPFADMVERYMKMWDNCLYFEKDIEARGVQVLTSKGEWKKNDSAVLLVNTNKQMLLVLEKLGVSASKIKPQIGGDI